MSRLAGSLGLCEHLVIGLGHSGLTNLRVSSLFRSFWYKELVKMIAKWSTVQNFWMGIRIMELCHNNVSLKSLFCSFLHWIGWHLKLIWEKVHWTQWVGNGIKIVYFIKTWKKIASWKESWSVHLGISFKVVDSFPVKQCYWRHRYFGVWCKHTPLQPPGFNPGGKLACTHVRLWKCIPANLFQPFVCDVQW